MVGSSWLLATNGSRGILSAVGVCYADASDSFRVAVRSSAHALLSWRAHDVEGNDEQPYEFGGIRWGELRTRAIGACRISGMQ